MILVDSSVWIDYFNGTKTPETDLLDAILGKELIVMGDLILVEVLQGFQADKDFETAKNVLLSFPFMNMCSKELAIESARNFRTLRKNGATVRKTIDVLIGTFCIHHHISLLHNDRDFDQMKRFLKLKTVLA
ncbi:MAG: type II toxin-antitoxin system VapC family toxin [Thermodesulfovibrionales bacterium]